MTRFVAREEEESLKRERSMNWEVGGRVEGSVVDVKNVRFTRRRQAINLVHQRFISPSGS